MWKILEFVGSITCYNPAQMKIDSVNENQLFFEVITLYHYIVAGRDEAELDPLGRGKSQEVSRSRQSRGQTRKE